MCLNRSENMECSSRCCIQIIWRCGYHVATTAIVFGMLLAGRGLGGYFGTGTSSLTALIPAAFGVVLTGLGVKARDAGKRKRAMHIAVAVAAVISQSAMAVI